MVVATTVDCGFSVFVEGVSHSRPRWLLRPMPWVSPTGDYRSCWSLKLSILALMIDIYRLQTKYLAVVIKLIEDSAAGESAAIAAENGFGFFIQSHNPIADVSR